MLILYPFLLNGCQHTRQLTYRMSPLRRRSIFLSWEDGSYMNKACCAFRVVANSLINPLLICRIQDISRERCISQHSSQSLQTSANMLLQGIAILSLVDHLWDRKIVVPKPFATPRAESLCGRRVWRDSAQLEDRCPFDGSITMNPLWSTLTWPQNKNF